VINCHHKDGIEFKSKELENGKKLAVHKDPPTDKYFKKLELEDEEDNDDKLSDYD